MKTRKGLLVGGVEVAASQKELVFPYTTEDAIINIPAIPIPTAISDKFPNAKSIVRSGAGTHTYTIDAGGGWTIIYRTNGDIECRYTEKLSVLAPNMSEGTESIILDLRIPVEINAMPYDAHASFITYNQTDGVALIAIVSPPVLMGTSVSMYPPVDGITPCYVELAVKAYTTSAEFDTTVTFYVRLQEQ